MGYLCSQSQCKLCKNGCCICECKEECFASKENKDSDFECPFQDGTPHKGILNENSI